MGWEREEEMVVRNWLSVQCRLSVPPFFGQNSVSAAFSAGKGGERCDSSTKVLHKGLTSRRWGGPQTQQKEMYLPLEV